MYYWLEWYVVSYKDCTCGYWDLTTFFGAPSIACSFDISAEQQMIMDSNMHWRWLGNQQEHNWKLFLPHFPQIIICSQEQPRMLIWANVYIKMSQLRVHPNMIFFSCWDSPNSSKHFRGCVVQWDHMFIFFILISGKNIFVKANENPEWCFCSNLYIPLFLMMYRN